MIRNFAMTGVAGYIAPRHLKAIRDTGGRLLAACDPKDSVGILDQFSFDVRFFTEIERLDRFLEKQRRGPEEGRVHFLTVCSPNYLHDAHCRLGLRVKADVICEKPLVLSPWNLDQLQEIEQENGRRIYTVLQLRHHPRLMELREQVKADPRGSKHDVELTYITGRGNWYHASWKGDEGKSGGIATNIGVHFFDLLIWLFGSVVATSVHLRDSRHMSGSLELERARVKWFLSVDVADLPPSARVAKKTTHRSITVDGTEVEFSDGFTDLHTRVYESIFAGTGYGIETVRPSIELVYQMRTLAVVSPDATAHPYVLNR